MSLSVGIVGLPNVGKSTLFNALTSRRLAETAPRSFTTIDPNEAVVAVPDEWLDKLWDSIAKRQAPLITSFQNNGEKAEKVPATVTFIDIAGLVKNAHKGEGLGNQFLAKIREVDVIIHVVRTFSDVNVSHSHLSHILGSPEQIMEDIEMVNLEMELGGIEKKPTIYVLNTEEKSIKSARVVKSIKSKYKDAKFIQICAKLEEELIDFDEREKKEYAQALGIGHSALDKLIKKAYELLGLISFYTIKGGKEISAFSLVKGKSALDAAEIVHTDFAKKFIKAEVIQVNKLLEMKGWKEAKEKGKIRLEGRDYVVQDGDVIEFKVGA